MFGAPVGVALVAVAVMEFRDAYAKNPKAAFAALAFVLWYLVAIAFLIVGVRG